MRRSLAIIGGGLAGIAAAEEAVRQGFTVDLFEWSRVLGGRAGSLFDPVAESWLDNGQHVALGCCKEFLALNDRLGLNEFFEQKTSIPFAQTGGKQWIIAPSCMLPTSWQLLPAFMRIPLLTFRQRIATAFALRKLGRKNNSQNNNLSNDFFNKWLKKENISPQSIENFWEPLILSALCDTVDNVAFDAVQKVVQDSLMADKNGLIVHIPQKPLRTIYHDKTSEKLNSIGVNLHFLKRLKSLHWEFSQPQNNNNNDTNNNSNIAPKDQSDQSNYKTPLITGLEFADGNVQSFDRYILAVPAFRAREILEASELETFSDSLGLAGFEPGAITSVHLWLNHRLLPENHSHSALVGGVGQFLFCPKSITSQLGGFYHVVLISASHRILSESELTSEGATPLVQRIIQQLKATFKNNQQLKLLHHRVTTYFEAVFSPHPLVYSNRPTQKTPFNNFAIAGDWTQTGWPSTLEGAVRSGILAVNNF
ncbi:MAG: hydroxysqualene dehydroxylase HpnE [Planctomycetaceae bacterium]|jgi:squalene-associated FAD-dependent desaturase|nr:hydroxysqualene dehydroxylase HpnE [Planctomycetaceae bacterium]